MSLVVPENVMAGYLYLQGYMNDEFDLDKIDVIRYHSLCRSFIDAMNEIALSVEDTMNEEEIQAIVFNEARAHFERMQTFFEIFYRVMFQTDRGPKMGALIYILGIDAITDRIESNLRETNLM